MTESIWFKSTVINNGSIFYGFSFSSKCRFVVIEKHFKITIAGGNRIGLFIMEADKFAIAAGISLGDRIIEVSLPHLIIIMDSSKKDLS